MACVERRQKMDAYQEIEITIKNMQNMEYINIKNYYLEINRGERQLRKTIISIIRK